MAKKKTKQQNGPPEGFIIVNDTEPWLNLSFDPAFADNKFFRIVIFYIIHSPCKSGSYSRIKLEEYGWSNPWHFDLFKDKFDGFAGFKADKNFFYTDAQKHFKAIWEDSGLKDDFYNIEKTEFAVFCYTGESNPRLDLLHHIRNSLSHGRFTAKRFGNDKEFYVYMEDVNDSGGYNKVNARMCLKKSTLINWINFFELKTKEAKKLCKDLSRKNTKNEKRNVTNASTNSKKQRNTTQR